MAGSVETHRRAANAERRRRQLPESWNKKIDPAWALRSGGVYFFRLTDLHHTTKIDTIAKALYSLGRHLELSLKMD